MERLALTASRTSGGSVEEKKAWENFWDASRRRARFWTMYSHSSSMEANLPAYQGE